MKNVLKIGFVAGFTFFSSLVFGKDSNNIVSLEKSTTSSISVGIAKAKNVSLYIYNASNDEIYAEKISNDIFMRSYNFKNLPSGTYYLVAETDSKIEKYKIRIKNHVVTTNNTPVEEFVKPQYTKEGNIVKLEMTDLKNKVRVVVSDNSDYEYYSETKTPINGKLTLNFNLNPDVAENYVIRIEKNNGTLKQTFTVK